MVELIVLFAMSLFALLAIESKQMRLAIVFLAVFSLLTALIYLLYAAPELAIAEGVIGSGIVTLLYLAALKKNRVYTIGLLPMKAQSHLPDRYMQFVEHTPAILDIRKFFRRREVEVQLVFLDCSLSDAKTSGFYDLIIEDTSEGLVAYTDDDDYVAVELELMFQLHGSEAAIHFSRQSEGA
jgi:putative multicomponent Na+:H+ antiporter subunit B